MEVCVIDNKDFSFVDNVLLYQGLSHIQTDWLSPGYTTVSTIRPLRYLVFKGDSLTLEYYKLRLMYKRLLRKHTNVTIFDVYEKLKERYKVQPIRTVKVSLHALVYKQDDKCDMLDGPKLMINDIDYYEYIERYNSAGNWIVFAI
jgi:hypothetical protein